MPLQEDEIWAAARRLLGAERSRCQIGLLSEAYPHIDLDDAYAIQARWVAQKVAEGDPVKGWKIGLTSKAMQSALSIDTPDSGVLLESMLFPNGAAIAPERFIEPRVEAEVAFIMKEGLAGPGVTAAMVLAAIDYVVPALEILDTRIVRKSASGNTRTVFDTIADNAANGGIVIGEPAYDLTEQDMRWMGAIVARDGEIMETGLGAAVLGSPLESAAWLANRLALYGQRILPGEILLSGSFIRPIEASPGSHIRADFGAFGVVSCSF